MRAVVVIAEENQPADIRLFTKHGVVRFKDMDAMLVSFRAVGGAGAVAVLGNHDRLIRKGGMNFVEALADSVRAARIPGAEIFVAFDEIHQTGNVFRGCDP